MPKVLVLFHSRTGNTAALADAVAEGATSVRFAEVELRRIDDLAPASEIAMDGEWMRSRELLASKYRTLESIEALAQYDALIVGSPFSYGIMSAEVKYTLDRAESLWRRGALVDKVGSAFGTGSGSAGNPEVSVASMLMALMHFGMILVPPGESGPAAPMPEGDSRPAATTARRAPTADELAVARRQGARVARVAEWVRHAKSHERH